MWLISFSRPGRKSSGGSRVDMMVLYNDLIFLRKVLRCLKGQNLRLRGQSSVMIDCIHCICILWEILLICRAPSTLKNLSYIALLWYIHTHVITKGKWLANPKSSWILIRFSSYITNFSFAIKQKVFPTQIKIKCR